MTCNNHYRDNIIEFGLLRRALLHAIAILFTTKRGAQSILREENGYGTLCSTKAPG